MAIAAKGSVAAQLRELFDRFRAKCGRSSFWTSGPIAGVLRPIASGVLRTVIWRFLRNADVMRMTFSHTGW